MSPKILALKQAIPYLQRYRGKLFVIKIGGSLFEDSVSLQRIAEGISALHHVGIHMVLVHGGGPQLQQLADKLGVKQKTVAGRRVTNAETLQIAKMVFAGKLNTDLAALLSAQDVPVVGLTGVDGPTIVASRRPPVTMREHPGAAEEKVDFGYVGDIVRVQPALIEHLRSAGYVPILCSLAAGKEGDVLNVNADTVAQHVAVALRAEKYLNVGATPGILKDVNDPTSLLSYADVEQIEAMKGDGVIRGGMLPKADSCIAALRGGVKRVHIIDGREEDSLLLEVFTNEGCGTVIVEKIERNGGGNLKWS